jgi:hypothetical protein
MTENGLNIQTISTKRTDKQTARILLFRQVTLEKEKADPSHFLIFLLASRTNGTFGFARNTSRPFAKPKEPFFANAPKDYELSTQITPKIKVL